MRGILSGKTDGAVKESKLVIKNSLLSYLVIEDSDRQGRDGMERKIQKDSKVMWILKALLVSYIITGILLLILTFLMYKIELNEKAVAAAIIAVHLVSTLIGGIIIGKLARIKRYLWGMGLGVLYFGLLLLVTLGVYRTLNGDAANLLTTFILCAGGGMAGGMLS